MPQPVRVAAAADAPAIGRLLDAFNREFDDPTPGADAMAARVAELLESDDFAVLVIDPTAAPAAAAGGIGHARPGGDAAEPLGLAVLRFRPSLWSTALECYLAELYVVPELRGNGLGRALLTAAIDHARRVGADHMDLGTSEDDVAARALYASCGFTNREHPPAGPVMYVYEREL